MFILHNKNYFKWMIFIALFIFGIDCGTYNNDMIQEKYSRAKSQFMQGNIEKSLKLFEEVMEYPGYTNARVMAGKIYYYLENYPKAEKYFTKSIDEESGNINALYWMAMVKKKTSKDKADQNEAFELFDDILSLDSYHIDSKLQKASILEKQGNIDKAILEYKSALEIGSTLGLAYFKLGLIYTKADLLEQAAKEFDKAITLRPDDKKLKKAISIIMNTKKRDEKKISKTN